MLLNLDVTYESMEKCKITWKNEIKKRVKYNPVFIINCFVYETNELKANHKSLNTTQFVAKSDLWLP